MSVISRRKLFAGLGAIALGGRGHARAQELARFPSSEWEFVAPADAGLSEAQLIAEGQPVEGGDIERAVLDTVREGAESVHVRRRGRKLRGAAEVTELEFSARVENTTYLNHGYFYSGGEGSVQLRGWSAERDFRDVSSDIAELLDGLTVTKRN